MESAPIIDSKLGSGRLKQNLRKWLAIAGVFTSMALWILSLQSTKSPADFPGAMNEKVAKTASHPEEDRQVDREYESSFSLSSLRSSNTGKVNHRARYKGLSRQLEPANLNYKKTPYNPEEYEGITISQSESSEPYRKVAYNPEEAPNDKEISSLSLSSTSITIAQSSIQTSNSTESYNPYYQYNPYYPYYPYYSNSSSFVFYRRPIFSSKKASMPKKGSKKGRRNLMAGRDLRDKEYFYGSPNYIDETLDNPPVLLDPEDRELMEGENPCNKVDPMNIEDNVENRKKCKSYLSLPYIIPNCTGEVEKVPRIFHSVGRNVSQFHHQFATEAANPDFFRHHLGDLEALEYVRERCGTEAAEAYLCLAPPANRGDLFRFCALYSEGGVYLDEDIFPIYPLKDLYSPCSTATIGHDYPQSKPGKQMKILAGAPGAPIFECALKNIIERVRNREYPRGGPLELSGPLMLHQCYEKHPEDVAITYHDTRNAQYPFSGMRHGNTILAYEVPLEKRHMVHDPEDYAFLFHERKVYRETCPLEPDASFPSVAERVKFYMGSWYEKSIAVDTKDFCQSVWYYHLKEGQSVSEDKALFLQPYLFNKDVLVRDVYFNSTLSHLVPWLGHKGSDPLLLHFTEDTPSMLYPFPVITNSRSIEPARIDPYYLLPLVAPLQADLQFGPLSQVQERDIPWERKKDSLLVWSEEDNEEEDDDEDFSNRLRKNPILMKERLAHKYLLSFEGKDVATELSWKLYSNSVVFMPLPKYVSWAMEDKLVPFYHYIPLKDDLSDLDEKIEWARKNDDKCKLIAQRATMYVEDLWMSEKAQSDTAKILKAMIRRYQNQYGDYLSSCKKPSTSAV